MIINGYCTLDEFKDHLRAGNTDLREDPTDDNVIERIIQQTSRFIDAKTQRHFYPIVETRYFDTPENTLDDRVLWLDDDLLAVTTVTNGDDTTLSSTEYNLYPANEYPKYALRIKQSSDYYWERDSSDNREQVIDILGFWGYHNDYSRRAWLTGSTLNEGGALTSADVTLTVASSVNFEPGDLIKIENELMLVKSKSGSNIVVYQRGENGSTAATHADTTTVYIWQVIDDIKAACIDIAVGFYKRRYGETTSGTATITGAGVVITPQDVPAMARDIIASDRRIV